MINVAVCDDNPLDLKSVKDFINSALKEQHVQFMITSFNSGAALLLYLEKNPPFDIIFLDIYMDDNGIETARIIREKDRNVKLVFITVSTMHAIESYEVFAYNYLVKPVKYEHLKTVITEAVEKIEKADEKKLLLCSDRMYYSFLYSEILYIESAHKKVSLYTAGGKNVECWEPLKNIRERLKDPRFICPHNSFIVNMDYVNRLDARTFILDGGKTADIARDSLKRVKQAYFDYMTAKITLKI